MAAQREPLARLSLNQGNRLSLAPTAGGKSEGRLSLLAPARRESILPGGTAKPLGPGAAPAPRRPSLGRRNSTAVLPKAADPRPIGKKEYTAHCVKTVLAYLMLQKYDQPVNAKILNSPSRTDFKNIITFLFRQIDPNFDFGQNFEEEVRAYLKHFGYPVAISKVALIPVGSPHTWPHVLAALTWLVEFLTFDAEVLRVKMEKPASLDALVDDSKDEAADGVSLAVFFQHTVTAYMSFLEGSDNYAVVDEELTASFQAKNKQAADHIHKLEARVEELKAEKQRLKNTEGEIKSLAEKRDGLKLELENARKLVTQLREEKSQQVAVLEERQAEVERNRQQLLAYNKEKADLAAALEKQEFTPLQVQALSHQKQLLSESIATLEAQKEAIQQEIWAQEIANSKALFELEKRVKTYNESALALELAPTTARFAKGVDYQLKLNTQRKDVSSLVGLDLTRTVKPTLGALKKQLATEIASGQVQLRDLGTRLTAVADARAEQERKVKSLEERASRHEEAYRVEKEGAEVEINGSLVKIEGAELEVSQMKATQSRILEESETKIHQLDNELLQQRQANLAAREKLLREIQEMSDRVFEHKTAISRTLKEVLESVRATKEHMSRATFRTPGKQPQQQASS